MNQLNLKKAQVAASFALIFAAPLVATAANYSFNADSGALRVSYSDLNLGSDEGIAALYTRLQKATEQACDAGNSHQARSLNAKSLANACYTQVLSKLVAKVANERLTAVHES
jgi:UrcA family protein